MRSALHCLAPALAITLLTSPAQAQRVAELRAGVAPTSLRIDSAPLRIDSPPPGVLPTSPDSGPINTFGAGFLSLLWSGTGSAYAGEPLHWLRHAGIGLGAIILAFASCEHNPGAICYAAQGTWAANKIWSISVAVHDARERNREAARKASP